MSKHIKNLICLLICLCLAGSPALSAFADSVDESSGSGLENADPADSDNEEVTRELVISSLEAFLVFAENCRLDSYSRNLTVQLECDIDLDGTDFAGIPIFSGTFDGRGHSITGLSITGKGSVQGLFRYLTEDAVVRNLTVRGEVAPGGSRSTVGGIAGSNAGTIESCSFYGTAAGVERVGGIAGRNEVTGIVEVCYAEGNIHGIHFVGGMVGENLGVIRQCTNKAQLNATASQNNVEISDITLETLTGTESAASVTDVGGIAGHSSGVIRGCINHGNVGYQHMGYNVGGIVGTQNGYVTGCTNYGDIFGRKEAGGIVGQAEPASVIEYEADTLQILQQQLITMSEIIDRTKANAEGSASAITNQAAVLRGLIEDARDALDVLTMNTEEQELPDLDSIQAALNTLKTSLEAMPGALRGLVSASQGAVTTLKNDLEALSNQMNAISDTLDGASDHLGGSITDVSDVDTEEDLTSKVSDCVNRGAVSADINAGGIVGAIALENDLDPEDDVEISGELSLNFESEYRSVIMNSTNSGTVTAKKQKAGGIVGWMALGLVKDSLNTGEIYGDSADYVGGIAGQSAGYIRRCSSKCRVTGADCVGGIAGEGAVVSDCRSMVLVEGAEKVGAVLGCTEQNMNGDESTRSVLGNAYLVVESDMGGIDGISYSGSAEPLTEAVFLALEDLEETFSTVTVRFIFEDGTEQVFSVETGGELKAEDVPAVPEKEGYLGEWGNLEEENLSEIHFDKTFETVYTSLVSVIRSEQTDEKGLPILLAQGVFLGAENLQLKELSDTLVLDEGEKLIEGWEITLPEAGETVTLRYLIPEENRDDELKLMVKLTGRVWDEVDYTVDGSYLVFYADAEDSAFCLIEAAPDYRVNRYAAGAAVVVLIIAGAVVIRSRRAKRKSA